MFQHLLRATGAALSLLLMGAASGTIVSAQCPGGTKWVPINTVMPPDWITPQIDWMNKMKRVKDVSCLTYGAVENVEHRSALPDGWIPIKQYVTDPTVECPYDIKCLRGAPYGDVCTMLDGFFAPKGWVVIAASHPYMTIRNLNGAHYGNIQVVLAWSVTPMDWVVIQTYPGSYTFPSYNTLKCLHLAPIGAQETVLWWAPLPQGWTEVSRSGNYKVIKKTNAGTGI